MEQDEAQRPTEPRVGTALKISLSGHAQAKPTAPQMTEGEARANNIYHNPTLLSDSDISNKTTKCEPRTEMKTNLLLRKLYTEGREFLTSEELKHYCTSMKLDYETAIDHFVKRHYLIRIFRGIFYVRSLEELKLGKAKYSHLELVAKGMELKNVENWYFGLYTALKLNNMTHEHFAAEYVVNDRIFRSNPVNIAGHRFRFVKLASKILGVGVVGDAVRYSDPEKTVLDFIYLWRQRAIPKDKIVLDIAEWARNLSKEKTRRYTKEYPKTVGDIAREVFR